MSSMVEELCYRWDILLIQVYCKDHGNWGPDNHGLTVVSYDKKKKKKRKMDWLFGYTKSWFYDSTWSWLTSLAIILQCSAMSINMLQLTHINNESFVTYTCFFKQPSCKLTAYSRGLKSVC